MLLRCVSLQGQVLRLFNAFCRNEMTVQLNKQYGAIRNHRGIYLRKGEIFGSHDMGDFPCLRFLQFWHSLGLSIYFCMYRKVRFDKLGL